MGASLPMPEQQVRGGDDGGFTLEFRPPVPAEEWNAQVSLLTGTAAAAMMLEAGLGVLRTMPAPDRGCRAAVPPRGARPRRRLGRGAGATATSSGPSTAPTPATWPSSTRPPPCSAVPGTRRSTERCPRSDEHAAVAAPYAHVTAPLRRLVDRFALVVCEAVCRGGGGAGCRCAIVPATTPGAHARVRPPCPRRRAGVRRRHRGGRAPRTGGGDVHGRRPRPHREGHGRPARRACPCSRRSPGTGRPSAPEFSVRLECIGTSEPVRCPSSIPGAERGHALPGLYTGIGRVGRTVA